MTDSNHIAYRPDIDGLRAIAVLSVLFFHAFPTGSFKGGFVGVDVFFVISGFLISSNLFRSHANGTFVFADFYARRALRIFPALVVLLASCLVFGWFGLYSNEFAQLSNHVIGGAAFVANLVNWIEIGYFDTEASLKPLLHLWSLGIEEQFYLIWPLVLYSCWRKNWNISRVVLVVLALSFGVNIFSVYMNSPSAFYSPIPRFWELLAGAYLAYRFANGLPLLHANKDLQAWAGLLCVVVAIFGIKKYYAFPGGWALFPIMGAVLLISAGPTAWVNRRILENRLLVWVGLISYPLYLWHWPLLSFLRVLHDQPANDAHLRHRWIAVGLAVLLAWVTYRFIERPIRSSKQRMRWAVALTLVLVAIGGAAFALGRSEALTARLQFEPAIGRVLFEPYPHPLKNDACRAIYPELKNEWSCLLSKEKPADTMILGDSHAHQYFGSLAANLPHNSVLNVSYPNCLPFSARRECRERIEKALGFLAKHDSIKTVVLTGYFSVLQSGYLEGNIEGKRRASPLTDEDRRAFAKAGVYALSQLVAQRKRVVVVLDMPDLIFRPRECVKVHNDILSSIRGNLYKKPLKECTVPVEEFKARRGAHDGALRELLSKVEGIEVFDPQPLFCDSKECRVVIGGQFMYWNSDHLTEAGSDLVIRQLVKEVKLGQ